MAQVRNCDKCGAPGARTVTAALSVVGLVTPETATGGTLSADACEAHFAAVAGTLHQHIVEHLAEQGTHHAAIAAADKAVQTETEALAEFEAGPLRVEWLRCREEADAAHAAACKDLAPDAPKPPRPDVDSFMRPDVRAAWQARVDGLAAARDRHRAALAEGTAASDDKHRAVARDLAKAK